MPRLIDLPDAKGRYPFPYVPAAKTDLKARFDAERKRLAEEAKQDMAKVSQLKRIKK